MQRSSRSENRSTSLSEDYDELARENRESRGQKTAELKTTKSTCSGYRRGGESPTWCGVSPLRANNHLGRATLGSESSISGIPACLARFSSINESLAPESTKRVRGSVSCAHKEYPRDPTERARGRTKLCSTALLHALTGLVFHLRRTISNEVTHLSAIQAGPRGETFAPLRRCQPGAALLHWLILHEGTRSRRRGAGDRGVAGRTTRSRRRSLRRLSSSMA